MDAAGDFTIAWSVYNEALVGGVPDGEYNVYARLFNPNGTSYVDTQTGVSGEFLVNLPRRPATDRLRPSLAA